MFSESQLQQFKNKLENERKTVEQEIKELEKMPDFGSDIDHFDEETDEAEEYGNAIGIIQALKERLNEINDALDKMASGRYGVCENCGAPISSELLEINPESRLCQNCKK